MFAFGCGVLLVIHWLGVRARRRPAESGASVERACVLVHFGRLCQWRSAHGKSARIDALQASGSPILNELRRVLCFRQERKLSEYVNRVLHQPDSDIDSCLLGAVSETGRIA